MSYRNYHTFKLFQKLTVMAWLLLIICTPSVLAISPTVTQSASPSAKPESLPEKEVQDLKNKIASKVSELTKKKKKGISGVISEITDKKIKITSDDKTVYNVQLDDVLTKYYVITGVRKTESSIKSFGKGDFIIVVGPETEGDVVANAIYKDEQYIVGSGSVTEVNATGFYIKVVSEQKETLTIDVESTTKKMLVDSKTLELETIGFSKVKEGDVVHYVLKKTGKEREANRYSAIRIVVLPQEYFIK
jgi:RNase P/RNase MRP subunit p29